MAVNIQIQGPVPPLFAIGPVPGPGPVVLGIPNKPEWEFIQVGPNLFNILHLPTGFFASPGVVPGTVVTGPAFPWQVIPNPVLGAIVTIDDPVQPGAFWNVIPAVVNNPVLLNPPPQPWIIVP
ncbi:hypothetical protein HD554DRAFT_2315588 [Boletus coccyginus]|nr:hypothetical protein HD554DRAFT_2315588 [Boletus coccyginus]